jgi:ComF family protein
MQVYNWIKSIPQTLYPARCLLCGAPGKDNRDLCPDCADALPYNRRPCRICALPLPPAAPADGICGDCQKHRPHFERCLAPLLYNTDVGQLISRLKFGRKLNHARLLSQLLLDHLEQQPLSPIDLLLPVPLHRQRLRERGYNQALEIARPLGRRFGIPVEPRVCRRTAVTPAQTGLDRKSRKKNLRNAFRVTTDVAGLNIVLIDDVVTTGETVSELTRCLQRAGAGRIEIWATARTPRG